MQVILLSVALALPCKGGWLSAGISKCFGKEDGTVQGLGDGKGALKKKPFLQKQDFCFVLQDSY